MPRDYRRYLPLAVLALGAAFTWNARSQAAIKLASPLDRILAEVPGFRTQPQKLSAEEKAVAGMSDYVARAYVRDSSIAFTTFVSYYERQTQGKTIHSPRNCLPGAGWEILTPGRAMVETADGAKHEVNRNILKNGPATAVVFYWYQGRGRVVANEYAVKWNLLRDAAVAGHTEEALVRIVVPVRRSKDVADAAEAKRNIDEATALGTDIAAKLVRDVDVAMPRA